ncbi:unnamed protein product [Bursaphelenchus xylophilus]|uniref:(pine wood nematode) hypothetical protein n=1 Tax=Bursaphelenchus xylophilus TaxID=6326 RepID=A0A1I7RKF5_BURXY|nr:unnamed protein product [Bursaphelenchus xylophilus]CAG9131351.1 unnamed protein product [Bursaphelenchus xylophilus]
MLRLNKSLLVLVCVLLTVEGYDSPIKTKAINQCKKYVSVFLSDSEYSTMADYVVSQIYSGTSWNSFKAAAILKFTTVSPSKSANVVGLGTKYITSNLLSGGTTTVSNAISAVGNNVEPFYNQLLGYIKTKKSNGMLENGCYHNVYRLATQWITYNRVKLIMQRVKTKLGTKWTTFTSATYFGPLFEFGNYTLT